MRSSERVRWIALVLLALGLGAPGARAADGDPEPAEPAPPPPDPGTDAVPPPPDPGTDVTTREPTPAERGRMLYVARCVACHGEQGAGEGPAAPALSTPVPDMTTASFWSDYDPADLRLALTAGRPSGVMRSFELSDRRLEHLIAYLETLRPEGGDGG